MNICMLGLVRATAMNASRAKRAMMSHYQTYYEERAKSLDSIIDKFKHQTTFEEYISNVYSPNGGGSCIIGGSVASVTRSDMSSSHDTWTHSDTLETRPRAHTGLDTESNSSKHGQSQIIDIEVQILH